MTAMLRLIICLCLFGFCVSCQPKPPADLKQTSYNIADGLIANLKAPLPNDPPLLITTFANVDKIQESSTMGRMLSEMTSSRFSTLGYNVREIKMTSQVMVRKGQGEFMLSREAKELSGKLKAYAVVVGVYGSFREDIFVAAKIVRCSDDVIIASYDYKIPKEIENNDTMLDMFIGDYYIGLPPKKSAN